MEAGPASLVAKVPSRPTFSRPPFPHIAARAPAPRPAVPRLPGGREPRPAPVRPGTAPVQRDNWRRRRDRPDPGEERDYQRMVQVIGFPPYTQPQDLAYAFSEFGNVKVDRIVENTAALVFSSHEDAKAAIRASRTVVIYGEFLTVKPYNKGLEHRQPKQNKREARNKPKGPVVEPASIPWTGDFSAQLDALLSAVRLSQHEIQQLATLYRDLEMVLQAAWPGCRAIPFGSVTTGLGVKSSDADCFVLLPRGCDAAGAVPRARRLLSLQPRVFTELVAIPRANTPIVKCFHLPTRTHCDVSFKTPLGAQNSKLISFLLYADPRLIPVAVVVKYWASVHELTGTGRLTNYALTMLIIFYLQQPPGILPPVEWLQRDRSKDFIVDFWNTGFMDDHFRLPPTSNFSSVAELLGGFFEFYSKFNFEELVVCPYLGRPMKKDDFKDPNLLPSEFERYRANVAAGVSLPIRFTTSMCVQDPFEQCHNVASPVSTRLAADIRAYFKFAADAYEKGKPCCRSLLKTILMEKPKLPRGKANPEYRVKLPLALFADLPTPDWTAPVRDIVLLVFQTILKIKLDRVIPDKERENTDGKESKRVRERYTGSVTRAIWKRKQFSKLYSVMGLKFVDRETMITEEILKIDKNVISVEFQLVLSFGQNPRSLIVVLKPAVAGGSPVGELNDYKEFGKFFLSNIHNWVLTLLKPFKVKKERKKKNSKQATENSKNDDDASDEEHSVEQLTETIKQGVDEVGSDSDSDESYEDERIDPNAGGSADQNDSDKTQSDSDLSPSDADKENKSESSNNSIEKGNDVNKVPGGKNESGDDKTPAEHNRDIVNDALRSVSDGKTQIDKLHKCEVDKVQNGGDEQLTNRNSSALT